MISLNDYLFFGNTVLKILHQYFNDLRNRAKTAAKWKKKYLYEIANALPEFLEDRGFTPDISRHGDIPVC